MLKIYLLSALVAGTVLTAPAQTLDPTFASLASVYRPGGINYFGPQQADGKRVVLGGFERLGGCPRPSWPACRPMARSTRRLPKTWAQFLT